MAEGKTLKEKNAGLIRAAMIGHVVAFAWIAAEPLRLLRMDGPTLASRLEAAAAPGTAALGLILVASLILLGMLNPNWRDRLIHWRWRDPLPGCRAFTEVGPASSHVDMDRLPAKFGPLPTDGAEQNRLFYRIYRDYRDDVGVMDAHRRYLAARDIGTITALVMLVLPWLAWWASGNVARALFYGLALVVVYGLSALAARNYGLRMVQHVLALASAGDAPAARS
jgi:hypothetical protein